MKLSRMRIKSGYRGCFPLYSQWKHATTTMDLKKLFTEERAVSPVIGVILMVAITVILAAVIGAFVLGLGGETQETPQASLSFELDESNDEVTIEHRGGDTLDTSTLNVTVAGTSIGDDPFDSPPDTFGAGETITTDGASASADERVRVVHSPTGSVIGSGTL